MLPFWLNELWLGGRQVHDGYSERATMVTGKFPGKRAEYDGEIDTQVLSRMVMLYIFRGEKCFS